jgi:membrane protein implicated in regulation of membrane protease activity
MLFEGRNSLTILGIHMLIMGVVAILLKRFMQVGGLYYAALFIMIVIVSNICIVLFNRYVPFLVNHKK